MTSSNGNIFRGLPAQRPVTRSFDVFFDLCLNKRLSKQSWGWWFETLSRPLWRHCNVSAVLCQTRFQIIWILRNNSYRRSWIKLVQPSCWPLGDLPNGINKRNQRVSSCSRQEMCVFGTSVSSFAVFLLALWGFISSKCFDSGEFGTTGSGRSIYHSIHLKYINNIQRIIFDNHVNKPDDLGKNVLKRSSSICYRLGHWSGVSWCLKPQVTQLFVKRRVRANIIKYQTPYHQPTTGGLA